MFESSSYVFTMEVSAAVGSDVGTTTATTNVFDGTVFYEIIAGNDDGTFTIGETTGLITLMRLLEHSLPTPVTLTIEASDWEGRTLEVAVEVHVLR